MRYRVKTDDLVNHSYGDLLVQSKNGNKFVFVNSRTKAEIPYKTVVNVPDWFEEAKGPFIGDIVAMDNCGDRNETWVGKILSTNGKHLNLYNYTRHSKWLVTRPEFLRYTTLNERRSLPKIEFNDWAKVLIQAKGEIAYVKMTPNGENKPSLRQLEDNTWGWVEDTKSKFITIAPCTEEEIKDALSSYAAKKYKGELVSCLSTGDVNYVDTNCPYYCVSDDSLAFDQQDSVIPLEVYNKGAWTHKASKGVMLKKEIEEIEKQLSNLKKKL